MGEIKLVVKDDIKKLENNEIFKYVLKSRYLNIIRNKEFSLDINDIDYNIQMNNEQDKIKEEKRNKILKMEDFLEDYVIKDLEINKNEDEYNINCIYTSFPLYLDRKTKDVPLKLEIVAIVEVKTYKANKRDKNFSYIFCDDYECLAFISSSTVRLGITNENDME